MNYHARHIYRDKNDIEVSITQQGINAALSEAFKIKQHDWFWKAVMNVLMTVANVAVAITAIWALTKDSGELERIEERLKKIEKIQEAKEVKANPNSVQTLNMCPDTTIKSVDTAKSKNK